MKVALRAVIHRPVEEVFDFVADMHNDPQWASMVSDVEQIDGEGPGIGATWRYKQSVGRREVDMEMTMIHYERPHVLAWRMANKAIDYQATMRFAPHPQGTLIQQANIEEWPRAPWYLKLMMPRLVRKQLRRQMLALDRALSK